MKKNKIPLIVLSISFLIGIIGGSIAYFKNETTITNQLNLAKFETSTTETFEAPTNWRAGETIPKVITTTNTGTVPVAVRISYTEKWTDEDDNDLNISDAVTINRTNENRWIKDGDYYYYKYIVNPNQTVKPFMDSVTLNSEVGNVTCTQPDINGEQVCESLDDTSGNKYTLIFKVETADSDYYKNIWYTNVEIDEFVNPLQFEEQQTEGVITTGDLVKIGDTEEFYVVSSNAEKTVLLARYNLLVGNVYNSDVTLDYVLDSTVEGYGLQNSNAKGYVSNSEQRVGTVSFSNTNYWNGKVGTDYLGSFLDPNYPSVYDENSIIFGYVNDYKDILLEDGVCIIDARLLTYQEAKNLGCSGDSCASAPNWLGSRAYWLGSANTNDNLWRINTNSGFGDYGYNRSYGYGVRPVIVVSTADFYE